MGDSNNQLEIKYKEQDGELIIELPVRESIKSILELEREIYCIINRGESTKTHIDVSSLEYISLSELRVFEKLKMEFGNLKIINLRSEVIKFVKEKGYSDLC